MSKGNPIIPVRLTPELIAEIEAAIERANDSTARADKEPYTVSEWIRSAIREKLAHGARGRSRKQQQPTA